VRDPGPPATILTPAALTLRWRARMLRTTSAEWTPWALVEPADEVEQELATGLSAPEVTWLGSGMAGTQLRGHGIR